MASKKSKAVLEGARKIQVGEWLFDLDKLMIIKGSDELSLEPKIVDLLSYLICNPNRVISKQELMENVWKTVVSDNTVSRGMFRLRQIFNDDPQNPVYITTVPRKGYRLIASVTVREKRPENKTSWLWLAAILAVLLVVLIGTHYWPVKRDVDTRFSPMKLVPVTALVGDEVNPALSSDGKLLAFSHRESIDQPWKIMVKSLETQEISTITSGTSNAGLPAWSPDNSKLLYKSMSPDHCRFFIVDVSDLKNPVMGDPVINCNVGVGNGNAVWGGLDVLYYTEAESANAPFMIYRYHLSSKNRHRISSPPNSGKGDYRLQPSPDGKWLAFVRDVVYWGQSELWLHAIKSGETRRITSLPIRLRALTWLSDSKHLVVANVNKQLQTVNIDTGASTVLTSEVLPLYHPSAGGEKLVASAGSYHRREIWRAVGEFGKETPEITSSHPFIVSSQTDYLARLNPNSSQVAFISERSGLSQIWLRNEMGELHQLTDFDKPYLFRTLSWSPDGTRLAAAASNRLVWLDVDNREVFFGPSDIEDIAEPVWGWDNQQIYFSQKVDVEWQLFSFSTANSEVTPITQAGGHRSSPSRLESAVFLSKIHEPGLWKLDLDSGEEILMGNWLETRSFNRNWVMSASEQQFFFVDPQDVSTIQRATLGDRHELPIDVIQLDQNWVIDFDLSQDQKTLLYSRTVLGDSDIVLLIPSDNEVAGRQVIN